MASFQDQGATVCFAVVYFYFGWIDQAGVVGTDKSGRCQYFFIRTQVPGNKDGFCIAEVKFGIRPFRFTKKDIPDFYKVSLIDIF